MIQVELHDRTNALVKVLLGAKNAAYHAVLNSDGSGTFLIHRADPDVAKYGFLTGGIDGWIVHLLRQGPLESAFTDHFAFVVEAVQLALGQQEDAGAWIHVSGRGTLCLLEDRICWPPGFDGTNASSITTQWQVYATKSAGFIMDAEIDRSASRFALALTHTVQQSTVPQTVKLRFDNLRLLHDGLSAAGPMEGQMVGVDYQCFDQIGSDKSAQVTVKMAAQDSLLGVTLERDSRPVKNWVLAQGTGEGINTLMAVASDAPSIASLRRREGFQDARSVDNQGQLALVASGAVNQYKAVDQRITTRFFDSTHTQVYRDFGLGDTVGLAVAPLSFSSKYRVMGISVADVDAEHEECALDLNDMRTEYLVKLLKGVALPTQNSLNILNRFPQGAPQIDSQAYPDDCDPTHPFHFDFYLASNILFVNYAKLSFFLRAFRRSFASANSVTSAGGSGHTHNTPNHAHTLFSTTGALGLNAPNPYITSGGQKVSLVVETPAVGTIATDSSGGSGTSASEASHTHTVTPTFTDGIFEGVVATGVTVKVNGVDRTAALGGGSGFTTNQTELALLVAWLNLGAWNTIDLTPTGLGRITGHLTVVSYIQSV